jgi:hypothetical protein
MTNEKTVWIRDHNATIDHDFPFSLGEELTIDADGTKAIVEDAVWKGEDAPATWYTVTYYMKTSDGTTREIELTDLLQFNRHN